MPDGPEYASSSRACGVWMSAFFFLGPRFDLGTASMVSEEGAAGDGDAGAGGCRRALKDEMKSTARGESPRRLLKWLTASALESVDA